MAQLRYLQNNSNHIILENTNVSYNQCYTLTLLHYTVDTVLISFTAKSLQLVLRENDAKTAELKLVAKESELELENILSYPPLCALFEEFMISEHAPENLFFVRSIELFEDVCVRLEKRVKKIQKGESVVFEKIKKPVRLKTTFSPPMRKKIKDKSGKDKNDKYDKYDNNNKRGSSVGFDDNKKRNSICDSLFDDVILTKSDEAMDQNALLQNTQLNILAAVCSSVANHDALHDIFIILENIVTNIMANYITQGSNNQINLPGKMRVQLEENVRVFLSFLNDMNEARQDGYDIINNNNESDKINNGNNISNKSDDNINNYNNNNTNKSDDNGANIFNQNSDFNTRNSSCNAPNDIKNLFSKAKNECHMIMRKDTFARWRFTEKFSHFYESLQPPTNVGINILTDCET
jgi:hypothetical protein